MTRYGAWTTRQMGLCMKFDCLNRDKKCNDCIGASNPSEYIKGDTNGGGAEGKEGRVEGAQEDAGGVAGGSDAVV